MYEWLGPAALYAALMAAALISVILMRLAGAMSRRFWASF